MGEIDHCAVCNGGSFHLRIRCAAKSPAGAALFRTASNSSDKAPCHLLILSERQERDDGGTMIEGLPRSSLHLINHRLTFVPAGHEFYGWQIPRTLSRYTYFYIDPHRLLVDPDLRFAETEFKPHLFFFNQALWETLRKLKSAAENPNAADCGYADALSIVLAHELVRLNRGPAAGRQRVCGGLAGWQKRRMAEYIEEHLSNEFSLSTLAKLAGLSPFHFSRAFKESFGLPPQRYQASRRMEKAKELLA
jgi:AraC family transcriptional regulator